MQKSHIDIIMFLFCLNENHCGKKKNIYIYIKKKKIVIVKNNIAIRIAGKLSRYIDASMNRATPNGHVVACSQWKFEVLIPEPGRKVDRPFKVAVKWAATVNLCELQQMLTGRHVQLPQSAIQALDVVLRHSPSVRCVPRAAYRVPPPPCGVPTDMYKTWIAGLVEIA